MVKGRKDWRYETYDLIGNIQYRMESIVKHITYDLMRKISFGKSTFCVWNV